LRVHHSSHLDEGGNFGVKLLDYSGVYCFAGEGTVGVSFAVNNHEQQFFAGWSVNLYDIVEMFSVIVHHAPRVNPVLENEVNRRFVHVYL
jgi:hypothetical protein